MFKKASFFVLSSSILLATENVRTQHSPYSLTYSNISSILQRLESIEQYKFPYQRVRFLEESMHAKHLDREQQQKRIQTFLDLLTQKFDSTYVDVCKNVDVVEEKQKQMESLLQQALSDIADLKKQSLLDQQKINNQAQCIEALTGQLKDLFSKELNAIKKNIEQKIQHFSMLQEGQDAILAGYKLDIEKIQSAQKQQDSAMKKQKEDQSSKFLKTKSEHEKAIDEIKLKIKQWEEKLNRPKKTVANQTDKAKTNIVTTQTEEAKEQTQNQKEEEPIEDSPALPISVVEHCEQQLNAVEEHEISDEIIEKKQEDFKAIFEGIQTSQNLTDLLEVEIFQPLIKTLSDNETLINKEIIDLILQKMKTPFPTSVINKLIQLSFDSADYTQKMANIIQAQPPEVLRYTVALKAKYFYEESIQENNAQKLDNILKSILFNIAMLIQLDPAVNILEIVDFCGSSENTLAMECILYTMFESLIKKFERITKQPDMTCYITVLMEHQEFFINCLINSNQKFSLFIFDSALRLFNAPLSTNLAITDQQNNFFKYLKCKTSIAKMKVVLSAVEQKEMTDEDLQICFDNTLKNLTLTPKLIDYVFKKLSEQTTPFRPEDKELVFFAIQLAQTLYNDNNCLDFFSIPIKLKNVHIPSVVEIFKFYKLSNLDAKIIKRIRGQGTLDEKKRLESIRKC